MSTVYVDVFSMESTCRTRLEKIQLADPLLANKIALLAKHGLKVIVLRELHAETGISLTVAGMQKDNVQLVKIAYFFTAAEQE